jgi:hypothetical protein
MKFSGRLQVEADPRNWVKADLRLTKGRVELAAGDESLGSWAVSHVTAERVDGDRFALQLGEERAVFAADDALAFSYEAMPQFNKRQIVPVAGVMERLRSGLASGLGSHKNDHAGDDHPGIDHPVVATADRHSSAGEPAPPETVEGNLRRSETGAEAPATGSRRLREMIREAAAGGGGAVAVDDRHGQHGDAGSLWGTLDYQTWDTGESPIELDQGPLDGGQVEAATPASAIGESAMGEPVAADAPPFELPSPSEVVRRRFAAGRPEPEPVADIASTLERAFAAEDPAAEDGDDEIVADEMVADEAAPVVAEYQPGAPEPSFGWEPSPRSFLTAAEPTASSSPEQRLVEALERVVDDVRDGRLSTEQAATLSELLKATRDLLARLPSF